MTEAELIEVSIGYASSGGSYFTIWLTILSAYAVTAYLTGKSLTTPQILWLNSLYLFGALLAIVGLFGGFNSMLHYIDELRKLNPEAPQVMQSEILYSVTAFAVVGTFATLAFMWQIRHPKTERP